MESKCDPPLRIFVYGSLKGGYRNHQAYCHGFESFRLATVVGRLYRQADGYPMLIVPQQSILALGTANFQNDMEQLAQLEKALTTGPLSEEAVSGESQDTEQWQAIRGEIYEWPAGYTQAGDILSRLDNLEDFYPDQTSSSRKSSLYHRVILLARHANGVEPVWTFVAPQGDLPQGCSPMGRSWP